MSSFRKIVCVSLLILLSGLPSLAQTGSDLGRKEFALPGGHLMIYPVPEAVNFLFRSPSGRILKGSVSRFDGTFRLEGLTIQPTDSGLSFSFRGEEASVAIDQNNVSEDPAVAQLMASWRATQDLDDVQALELAFRTALTKQAADRGIQSEQAELSCGWEIVGLVGATAVGYAGCVSFFGCAGGYLLFLYQLKQTANSCNWCGFGRACGVANDSF